MGGMLVALIVGITMGVVGRLAMPGRRGLVQVLRRDPKRTPRLLTQDLETRWEVSFGAIGGVGGYGLGRIFDAQAAFGPTAARWLLCLLCAAVMVCISIASEVIERQRMTRRIGMHR